MITLDLNYLTEVCEQYDRTAPTVADYANDLYIRINEQPADVRLIELTRLGRLREEGTWLQPNYAANLIYKLMHDLGMDTTGQAGF